MTEDRAAGVADAIAALLRDAGAEYREVRHAPVRTAEEAAAARGTPLEIGAKSIVLKVDDAFGVYATSAATIVRARFLRRNLGAKRTRFATPEELASLTGLVPGSVPPFGEPVLPVPLFVDPSLFRGAEIAFTPGLRDRSIVVATADYRRIARPEVVRFAADPTPDV